MRRYAVNSVLNMRDLGGYSTKQGGYIRYGQIIRSDCPIAFDQADLKEIESLNLGTVIDLRTAEEIAEKPSYFSDVPGLDYYNVQFQHGNRIPDSEAAIKESYLRVMEDPSIREILTIISNEERGVLIHCAVGKDRTGVVAALLLMICQVNREEIISDYRMSYIYLHNLIEELRRKYDDFPEWGGQSKPEYMMGALDLLLRKYGHINVYLKAMGISDEKVAKIRRKMIEQ